jgi:ABC-type transporter Mla subunit MlaD
LDGLDQIEPSVPEGSQARKIITMSKTDATLQEILDRLDGLTETVNDGFASTVSSIDTLTRGLSAMLDTQRAHTDMLTEVLTACSADPGAGTDLTDALDRIVSAVEQQTETLAGIDEHLSGLGRVIEISVVRGIARVEAQREAIDSGMVDEDGVLFDGMN